MKSAQSARADSLLRSVASESGWSATRVESALRDAARRLKESERSAPAPSPSWERRVPQVLDAPPAAPTRSVRVQLASGRSVRVRMPEVASRHDVGVVGSVARKNARLQRKVLVEHARALDALSERDLELDRRLEALQAQADLAPLAALRCGSSVRQKLSETLQRVQAQEHTSRRLDERLAFQAQAARSQTVRAAVSSMQVAAYGKRGNVFETNNLLLGASELLWGSVDTLLRRLGLWSRPEPAPLTWVGPVLGLLVGHATVGQGQLERFVSGQLVLRPVDDKDLERFAFTGTLDLRPYIAPSYWDEFRKRRSVPATAQVTDEKVLGLAVASVEQGTLQVLALGVPDGGSVTVTWTVDVEAPGG